ncbi:MAG: glycerophosphodiester phosphodiesterase [Desulfohalobiaceae bacterium]
MTRFFLPEPPRLFAHRGDNVRYPENTLPAFRAAVYGGIPCLELDVWMTRDKEVVVHHDRTTARTCGRKEEISQTSFAKIRELDPGWGFVDSSGERPWYGQGVFIPTLEEVLDAFPQTQITVEIKQDSERLCQRLLEIVEHSGALDRILLASQEDHIVQQVRAKDPEMPTNFGYKEARDLILRASSGELTGYIPPAPALQIPPQREGRKLATPDVIRGAHSLGVEVHIWTVNDEQYARSLLDIGVDGIMSDDAEMLLSLMGQENSDGGHP